MNKLEICISELDEKVDGATQIGCKAEAKLSLPYCMCVQFYKAALGALERTDENVFMDALELYLKEKSEE